MTPWVEIDREILLSDAEARLLLEALAGLVARSGVPSEVTAGFRLAQRIEGFDVDGRGGARKVDDDVCALLEEAT